MEDLLRKAKAPRPLPVVELSMWGIAVSPFALETNAKVKAATIDVKSTASIVVVR